MNDYNNIPEIEANNMGNGQIRWCQRGAECKSRGAALLGRTVALYDHVMDYNTDLEGLATPEARAKKFSDLCIWIDNSSKKVRNAFKSICYDYPGKGREAVMDVNIELDEVSEWYDWQMDALYYAKLFNESMRYFWEEESIQMCMDLCIPVKKFILVNRWCEPMGRDMQLCTDHSIDARTKEEFIALWKEKENELLALTMNQRNEVKYEEDV